MSCLWGPAVLGAGPGRSPFWFLVCSWVAAPATPVPIAVSLAWWLSEVVLSLWEWEVVLWPVPERLLLLWSLIVWLWLVSWCLLCSCPATPTAPAPSAASLPTWLLSWWWEVVLWPAPVCFERSESTVGSARFNKLLSWGPAVVVLWPDVGRPLVPVVWCFVCSCSRPATPTAPAPKAASLPTWLLFLSWCEDVPRPVPDCFERSESTWGSGDLSVYSFISISRRNAYQLCLRGPNCGGLPSSLCCDPNLGCHLH